VLGRDGKRIETGVAEGAPALGVEPVAGALEVLDAVERRQAPRRAEIVEEIALGGLPVKAPEVGVAIRLDLAQDLLARPRAPEVLVAVAVVVSVQSAGLRALPVGRQHGDLAVGEWYQLDVGQARDLAPVRRRLVARSVARRHLAEEDAPAGQVGRLPATLVDRAVARVDQRVAVQS